MDLEARFFQKAIPEPNSGCWLWLGPINNCGYGRDGHSYAHRRSYEIFCGEIGSGLEVDHLCRLRCCVNPDHLEVVTPAENARRAALIRAAQSQRTETHCLRGHDLRVVGQRQRKDRPGTTCKACHEMYRRNFHR